MATRTVAEMLRDRINSQELIARRDKRAAETANRNADKSETQLQQLLSEACRQGLMFDFNRETGKRDLVVPQLGWDDERGIGKEVSLGR